MSSTYFVLREAKHSHIQLLHLFISTQTYHDIHLPWNSDIGAVHITTGEDCLSTSRISSLRHRDDKDIHTFREIARFCSRLLQGLSTIFRSHIDISKLIQNNDLRFELIDQLAYFRESSRSQRRKYNILVVPLI